MSDRRQFERIDLSENVRVRDDSGREFGRVQQVSGGGMMIATDSPDIAQEFTPGKQMRLTVIEPNRVASLTVDAVVRYRAELTVGIEFILSKPKGAGH